MPLDGGSQILLKACAQQILGVEPKLTPNLANLPSFHREPIEIADYLAYCVEVLSRSSKTIRRVDSSLIDSYDTVQGVAMYMVLCDFKTPPGVVKELTDDMVIVRISPFARDSLEIGLRRATAEAVAKNRARMVQARLAMVEQRRIDAEVEKFIGSLRAIISQRIALCEDTDLATELQQQLDQTIKLSLETVVAICIKLGLSPQELLPGHVS